MIEDTCKFAIGQLVHHQLADYRGVIIDVDATFQGTEEWYEHVVKSRPLKTVPRYRVLVHNADHVTYVAERNLVEDSRSDPIIHLLVDDLFSHFEDDCCVRRLN